MRRIGTSRLLIVAAIAIIITGCTTAVPVSPGPPQTQEGASPSLAPTAAMYDVEQAQSLMLITADTFDLTRAQFAIDQWSSSVFTGVLSDVYSEGITTATTSPEACGPVYWLAATGKAERDSTDPFVSGPSLVGVASDGASSESANAFQGVRIFATPEAARAHFAGVVSALKTCAKYQVEGQDGLFTYEDAAAKPEPADTIHLRHTQTSYDDGFGPVDTAPVVSDEWVFLRGNLLVIVEGHRDGGDVSALAGIIRARLDSLGSQR
jgi:hypothetical protein